MASPILFLLLALPILVNAVNKETAECLEEGKKFQGGPSCFDFWYPCCVRKCAGDSEASCQYRLLDRDTGNSTYDVPYTKCECKGVTKTRQDVTESCVHNALQLNPNSDICAQHSECCRQTCLARRFGGYKSLCVKDNPQNYDPGKAINMQHSQCTCGAGSLIISSLMIIVATMVAFHGFK